MTFSDWVDAVHASNGHVTTVPADAPGPYAGLYAAWYRNADYAYAANVLHAFTAFTAVTSDATGRYVYVVAPADAQTLTLWERLSRAVKFPDWDQAFIWGEEASDGIGTATSDAAGAVAHGVGVAVRDVVEELPPVPVGAWVAGGLAVVGVAAVLLRKR